MSVLALELLGSSKIVEFTIYFRKLLPQIRLRVGSVQVNFSNQPLEVLGSL